MDAAEPLALGLDPILELGTRRQVEPVQKRAAVELGDRRPVTLRGGRLEVGQVGTDDRRVQAERRAAGDQYRIAELPA